MTAMGTRCLDLSRRDISTDPCAESRVRAMTRRAESNGGGSAPPVGTEPICRPPIRSTSANTASNCGEPNGDAFKTRCNA